jgi:hypothetical protein
VREAHEWAGLKFETESGSWSVVSDGMDAKDVFELAAADDQQPVEALAADVAVPTLHVGVRVRCL